MPTNEAAVNSLAHLIAEHSLQSPPPNLGGDGSGIVSPDGNAISLNPDELDELNTAVDFIWSKQTVAAGDTAVLHCSFDAIFQQLRTGNVSRSEFSNLFMIF